MTIDNCSIWPIDKIQTTNDGIGKIENKKDKEIIS